VTAVGMMQVVADNVVDVASVRRRLVPAARTVTVRTVMPATGMARCAGRRPVKFMLVGALAFHVMQMAVVQVVDVAAVHHGGVPAAAGMDV